MRNIFISYAREDRAKIQQLAEALTQAGWSVWWDREIPLGRSYATVISDALESAHCVIVAWSRHAIASRWVQDEANHALSRGVLVPVMLETVAPPLGFGTLQAADLVGWNGDLAASEFVRLSDAVRGMIQHPNPTVPNVPPVVSPWAGPAPAPAGRLDSCSSSTSSITSTAMCSRRSFPGSRRPTSTRTGPSAVAPRSQRCCIGRNGISASRRRTP